MCRSANMYDEINNADVVKTFENDLWPDISGFSILSKCTALKLRSNKIHENSQKMNLQAQSRLLTCY